MRFDSGFQRLKMFFDPFLPAIGNGQNGNIELFLFNQVPIGSRQYNRKPQRPEPVHAPGAGR